METKVAAVPLGAKGVLFCSGTKRSAQLSDRPMRQADVYRMIQRCAENDGIRTNTVNMPLQQGTLAFKSLRVPFHYHGRVKQAVWRGFKLKMLPRLYRPGDGDCGICFEYVVHDAVMRRDAHVLQRIEDSLRQCRVPGSAYQSILFGAEKKGASQLFATAKELLTDDSRLLTGKQSQPPKLKGYLNRLKKLPSPNATNAMPCGNCYPACGFHFISIKPFG